MGVSARVDATATARVLPSAVDAGAVPHVAAIVADGDGLLYEGGAGPRIVGEAPETVSTSTRFATLSMTKIVSLPVVTRDETWKLYLDFEEAVYGPR